MLHRHFLNKAPAIVCKTVFALVSVNLASCSGNATPHLSSDLAFTCERGRIFHVLVVGEQAQILLQSDRLIMWATPSSLGQRYASDAGTLIIDDDFAALVLNNDAGYEACRLKPDA